MSVFIQSCTKDVECCHQQLCVWGQCSQNATKGEAGSTCEQQTDCDLDLCCVFHKALLFPVCSAKPIERERCFGASNHLMELLSRDTQDGGPRKHCPCAGDLQCQHLGFQAVNMMDILEKNVENRIKHCLINQDFCLFFSYL
uniref:Dickkopf WNT signaling pathway inhibitor 3a n=1 Tax=Nothobranchius furzeri TaxID=105023 RepID=A0A8C6PJG7_NOTFU